MTRHVTCKVESTTGSTADIQPIGNTHGTERVPTPGADGSCRRYDWTGGCNDKIERFLTATVGEQLVQL